MRRQPGCSSPTGCTLDFPRQQPPLCLCGTFLEGYHSCKSQTHSMRLLGPHLPTRHLSEATATGMIGPDLKHFGLSNNSTSGFAQHSRSGGLSHSTRLLGSLSARLGWRPPSPPECLPVQCRRSAARNRHGAGEHPLSCEQRFVFLPVSQSVLHTS